MPWKNENGTLTYKASHIYFKEYLPTYQEFTESIESKHYAMDSSDTKIDLYWKIPRQKVVIALLCNQLNKMLFEDGFKPVLINYLSKVEEYVDVRFLIFDNNDIFNMERSNTLTELPPEVYCIRNPKGIENPFTLISNHKRTFINDYSNEMRLCALATYRGENEQLFHVMMDDRETLYDFMKYLFKIAND